MDIPAQERREREGPLYGCPLVAGPLVALEGEVFVGPHHPEVGGCLKVHLGPVKLPHLPPERAPARGFPVENPLEDVDPDLPYVSIIVP